MQDTMRDGELARLIRKGKPAKYGLKERAIAALGERLTALGERLQEQHTPSPNEVHRPALHGSR